MMVSFVFVLIFVFRGFFSWMSMGVCVTGICTLSPDLQDGITPSSFYFGAVKVDLTGFLPNFWSWQTGSSCQQVSDQIQ